jgi:putative FmdB family regulatory protein
MPIYKYLCDPENGGCGERFETVQGYHDEPLKRCKACRKHRLRREITQPYFKQDPKTVGSLADINTAKMTQEQKDKIRKEKPVMPYPPWGKPPKGLMMASEEKKLDYIMTGKL